MGSDSNPPAVRRKCQTSHGIGVTFQSGKQFRFTRDRWPTGERKNRERCHPRKPIQRTGEIAFHWEPVSCFAASRVALSLIILRTLGIEKLAPGRPVPAFGKMNLASYEGRMCEPGGQLLRLPWTNDSD